MTIAMNELNPPEQDQVRELTMGLRQLLRSGEHFRLVRAQQLELGKNDLTALGHLYDGGPLTPRDLAIKMEMTSGTITPLLDRVEKAGFLTRNKNPEDRRSLLIAVTPAGQHALEWVYEQFDAVIRDALTDILTPDANEIVTVFELLSQALDANARIEAPTHGTARTLPPTPEPPTGPHAI